MSTTEKTFASHDEMARSLTNLRTELMPKAFDLQGHMLDHRYAEMVWKINACLFSGYPRLEARTFAGVCHE
tara:strand:- start:545 stop:757 length:213 start_codon:yes stop_codon:yes gene_type:complete